MAPSDRSCPLRRLLPARFYVPLLLVLIAVIALLALVLAALPAQAQSSTGSTVTATRSVATPPPRSTPRSGATSA